MKKLATVVAAAMLATGMVVSTPSSASAASGVGWTCKSDTRIPLNGTFVRYGRGQNVLPGSGPDTKLVGQGDGNLVLYSKTGQPLWHTATGHRTKRYHRYIRLSSYGHIDIMEGTRVVRRVSERVTAGPAHCSQLLVANRSFEFRLEDRHLQHLEWNCTAFCTAKRKTIWNG